MTRDQMYLRALDRLRTRIAIMERNLDGASLATHEEFEDLCLIIMLLEQMTNRTAQPESLLEHIGKSDILAGEVLLARANGQLPPK